MTSYTEPARTAEFIIYTVPEFYSVETVIVDAGAGALVAGNVLGKVTATGDYVVYNEAGDNGSEDVAGILYAAVDAVEGDAVVVNDIAVVKRAKLVYTGTEATVLAGLAAINIKTRV